MKTNVFTLRNGLTVVFIPTNQASITVLLLVGAGSRYENKKNNGIAHFFEHMAFKGSKKYPNTKIISETIEATGGIFNAFTSKDHTGYWIKATPSHFKVMIDVLSDMIINPILDPQEIEREKGVIIEEINMYEDDPRRKVGDLFENLIYQDHPLGMDIAGEKKTVKSFNKETFLDYIRDFYHPENAVLVIAGGINNLSRSANFKKNLTFYLSIIEEKISSWKNGNKKSFERINFFQSKPKILVHHKKTEQAHFCLGYPTFGFFDPRRYSLLVLATLLGGGMSSRLFLEVRERRGLCYYIFTGKQFYHEIGNIVTQAGIINNLEKIKEAISVIKKEEEKIKQGMFSKEELKKAKEMVKGKFLISLEDSFNLAHFFGTRKLLEEKIITINRIIKNIDDISAEQVIDLAQKIFLPEKLNFCIIGPYDEKDFKGVF